MSRRAAVIASLLAVTAVGGNAVAAHPQILNGCTTHLLATSGYTKCTTGTGLQRSKLYCYNGVDYAIEYGPWVGRGAASWQECDHGRSAVSISYQRTS